MALVLMMPACEGGRRARVKHTAVSAEALHACRAITDSAMGCWGNHRSGNLMPPAGGYQARPSAFDGGCLIVLQDVARRLADYTAIGNLIAKVLDFIKFGGPECIVDGTIFEMWLGTL